MVVWKWGRGMRTSPSSRASRARGEPGEIRTFLRLGVSDRELLVEGKGGHARFALTLLVGWWDIRGCDNWRGQKR